jgi:hypothetical protein
MSRRGISGFVANRGSNAADPGVVLVRYPPGPLVTVDTGAAQRLDRLGGVSVQRIAGVGTQVGERYAASHPILVAKPEPFDVLSPTSGVQPKLPGLTGFEPDYHGTGLVHMHIPRRLGLPGFLENSQIAGG